MPRVHPTWLVLAALVVPDATAQVELTPRGRFESGAQAGAEIVAYDAGTRRLYITNVAIVAGSPRNRIDVVDVSNVDNPSLLFSIPMAPYGAGINSVAVRNGIVAAAVEANPKTDPGTLVLLSTSGTLLRTITAGALPDHVSFSPDGRYVLVANEGEASSFVPNPAIDPPGSITVVDLAGGVANATVATLGFPEAQFPTPALIAEGVRIFPTRSALTDLEPEYIAVSPDSTRAFVSLQEANAFAIVDLASTAIVDIVPAGLRNHSLAGAGLDPSDRDNGNNGPATIIGNWPVLGTHMPDTVASFSVAGQTFFVSAGEGDSRDFDEVRVGAASVVLDPVVFPNATALKGNAQLGRLTVSNFGGDTDGDGDQDRILAYGSRSFSIFDANGVLVSDSGDELEQVVSASVAAGGFNSDNVANNSHDTRSDNKGPEPEAIAAGSLADGTPLVFVGMERVGGVAAFDVSNPAAPAFLAYANPRDFAATIDLATAPGAAGDLGPEGIAFIAASDSPTGRPMIAVANEISGTTRLFDVDTRLLSNDFE